MASNAHAGKLPEDQAGGTSETRAEDRSEPADSTAGACFLPIRCETAEHMSERQYIRRRCGLAVTS